MGEVLKSHLKKFFKKFGTKNHDTFYSNQVLNSRKSLYNYIQFFSESFCYEFKVSSYSREMITSNCYIFFLQTFPKRKEKVCSNYAITCLIQILPLGRVRRDQGWRDRDIAPFIPVTIENSTCDISSATIGTLFSCVVCVSWTKIQGRYCCLCFVVFTQCDVCQSRTFQHKHNIRREKRKENDNIDKSSKIERMV